MTTLNALGLGVVFEARDCHSGTILRAEAPAFDVHPASPPIDHLPGNADCGPRFVLPRQPFAEMAADGWTIDPALR